MSHIATVATEIRDLDALKKACAELGLPFLENQKTCAFWPKKGKPQQHPCHHAIQLPVGNFKMELGLVKTDKGYDLVGDDLLHRTDIGCCEMLFGQKTNPLGEKFGTLLQLYGVHKATMEARKRGYIVTRNVIPGTQKIQLQVSGI